MPTLYHVVHLGLLFFNEKMEWKSKMKKIVIILFLMFQSCIGVFAASGESGENDLLHDIFNNIEQIEKPEEIIKALRVMREILLDDKKFLPEKLVNSQKRNKQLFEDYQVDMDKLISQIDFALQQAQTGDTQGAKETVRSLLTDYAVNERIYRQ